MKDTSKEYKKQFTYKDYCLRLYENHIECSGKGYKSTYKINDFLEKTHLYPPALMFNLLMELSQSYQVLDFSSHHRKKIAFYQALNPKKLASFTKQIIYLNQELQKEFLLISDGKGLSFIEKFRNGREYLKAFQTFDDYYFHGPKLYSMSLELRRELLSGIEQALSIQVLKKIKPAPFMHYQNITPKTFHVRDGNKGEYIEVHQGYCLIGGYDAYGGGAQYHALEALYQDADTLIPVMLKHLKKEIKTKLEEAFLPI